MKLINRIVGSLKFESDPAIFGIVVAVGVDVMDIDADIGSGGGNCVGNGGCHW